MLTRMVNAHALACVTAIAAIVLPTLAAAAQPARSDATSRLIVKFRDAGSMQTQSAAAARVARFATDAAMAGVAITPVRAMTLGAHVMALDRPHSRSEVEAVVARLARHPEVEFVEPDFRRRAYRTTSDSLLWAQPYLGSVVGGINAFSAWDVTTGSAGVVVAVVDTGYRPHADLAGRILPGYDFIADPKFANDGDGRDADASDPGDWIDATDQADPEFSECEISRSSWHGTAVSGIIAANSDNTMWLAGINWAARILPVRVLGKCGGWDSDIIDGVAWAAGLVVPGVPTNPYPAQVINLSLGAPGSCLPLYHQVFSAAIAHGVTRAIVAAAGNDGADVADSVPSSCGEVIAVAATTGTGSLASYSNFGAAVALSAPGGSATDAGDAIAVLFNHGKTVPDTDAWAEGAGTSLSAPMVSAVASLMLGIAPNLGAAELRALLTSTVTPFPPGSDCDTLRCGAGIVNAQAAVVAAESVAPPVNYSGLWWNAPAGSENGWGINFSHQGNVIFGTWFTYGTAGKGWWLTLITNSNPSPGVYTADLFIATGPPFSTDPFVKPPGPGAKVGTATLTFTDVSHGTFHYDVNLPGGPVSQTKAITQQQLAAPPLASCFFGTNPNLAAATNYQGIWWAGTSANPATEPGWGINFTHQGDIVFASWFTYDLDGGPLWLVATAPKVGPGVYKGELYRPSGPRLDAYDKSQWTPNAPVGSLALSFADGNNATFAYTVQVAGMPTPVSQTKTITRQIFTAPGTACQ
jgi:serine protease